MTVKKVVLQTEAYKNRDGCYKINVEKVQNWKIGRGLKNGEHYQKNETGLEGGRYKRATQCLRLLLGVHKETAKIQLLGS